MTNTESTNGMGVIIITIAFAMLLMMLPMPDQLRPFRPEFVLMVLIYWVIALPRRVSVGFAWIVGVLMDALMGVTLGISAFSYVLVIFFTARFYLQLRQYPAWQQAFIIAMLVLVVHIIAIAMSSQTRYLHVWVPALSSMIIWPINYSLLRNIRRYFHVK